ncbi:hypothetical protein V498_06304 [Pseudogymnoascus sp. VKM F-4517 (FW-2822)]|nr:hypothetical protein V498_06304 [Pseudogymnoascus sp. VKM F-4517 (FW-2822)]
MTYVRVQNKGKRAVLKGHFHISTEALQSQVVEAEAATAAASQRSRTTPRPITYLTDITPRLTLEEAIIEEIDEESEEELYDSDLDELAL